MQKVNTLSVLYLPIHYILDAQNSGSEFSWSYEIYKHISKIKELTEQQTENIRSLSKTGGKESKIHVYP